MSRVFPIRLRMARWVLRHWPLSRGVERAERLLLAGFDAWPARGDVDFAFGRLEDVSLAAWPAGYRALFLRGVMEEAELAVWRAVLRPGDHVVDGGANLGYWTLAAASFVGPSGRVFAVEPVPATARALARNLEASGGGNVTLVQAALTTQPGEVVMNVFADDPVGLLSSVGMIEGQALASATRVRAIPLDALLAEHDARPVLVKLDVEGSETAALRGAGALLSGPEPPVLCCEWNESTAAAFGTRPEEWMELLAAAGYTFFLPAGGGRLVPFARPADARDWVPMVWCVPDRGTARARIAPLLP
jgi:FkbM family methyltransferase